MPATFTVDAYPGQVFRGTVTSIRKAAINVQNVVTYDVVVGVSNTDLKLFPGMTANVKILVDQHHDVLKIPNAALRFRPADAQTKPKPGAKMVWTLDKNGRPQPAGVVLGISDGAYTEITGGDLKEGDPVIIASFLKRDAAAQTAAPFGGGQRPMGRGPGF
jgi:HlyD family secretion protein